MRLRRFNARLTTTLAVSSLALAGCGSTGSDSANSATSPRAIRVVVGFYPLQFVAEQVAGDAATVTSLASPGAEPHDLELKPQDITATQDADLVIVLKDFQPAVDAATEGHGNAFDVAPAAKLVSRNGGLDQHFWLDPTRMADVADAVADRLARVEPAKAADFTSRAKTLRTTLTTLDSAFSAGLATCASRDVVTTHAAFGYLTQRYGLVERSVVGSSPEAEPSAADLAKTVAFVKTNRIATIYAEPLVSSRVMDAIAAEAGARVATLDPVEAITSSSAGTSYILVMQANLRALQAGQQCAPAASSASS